MPEDRGRVRRGGLPARLGRLLRLPVREQLTTLHALLALSVLELLIRHVRLPRLAALAGVSLEPSGTGPDPGRREAGPRDAGRPAAGGEAASGRARRAVRCTRRVLRSWPFGDGPCLRESLVVGHLLRHESPLLRIGVASRTGGLRAHAWLEVGGRALGASGGFTPFGRVSNP